MVLLHTGLLVGCAGRGVLVRRPVVPLARLVDARAGRRPRRRCAGGASPPSAARWNTRVIVVPGPAAGPPQARTAGCPHPNYVAVVVEGIALPLVHAAWITAAGLHGAQRRRCCAVRIRVENAALATLPAERSRRVGPAADASTCWSPAAGRSGSPPRCTPPAAGLDVVVVEPRRRPDRQGLRRGADARRPSAALRRARRATRRASAFRGIRYLATATSRAERTLPARPRARGAPDHAARGAARAPCRRPACTGSPVAADAPVRDRRVDRRRSIDEPRYLVAADGLHSPVRRGARPRRRRRRGGRARYGLRRHARAGAVDATSSRCTGRRRAEAYVTPVADDLVGVAVLDRAALRVRRAARASSRRCAERLAARRRPARSAAPGRCASGAGAPGAPAGCCWSATPPATSTRSPARDRGRPGLRPGAGGRPGGRRPAAYERAWRRATRRYRVLTRSLLWAAGPGPACAGRSCLPRSGCHRCSGDRQPPLLRRGSP